MKEFWGIALFGGALFFASAAWAAEITPGQGDLSINQGQGFQTVGGRVQANVGDSVMVAPNGSAVVSYTDGCQVSVQPGTVMTIAPLSPCASGSLAQDFGSPPVVPIVLGALFAVGLGFGIYEATRTTSAPASP